MPLRTKTELVTEGREQKKPCRQRRGPCGGRWCLCLPGGLPEPRHAVHPADGERQLVDFRTRSLLQPRGATDHPRVRQAVAGATQARGLSGPGVTSQFISSHCFIPGPAEPGQQSGLQKVCRSSVPRRTESGDADAVRVIGEVLPCRLDHRFADLQADVVVGRAEVGDERKQRLAAGASHVDDGGPGLHEASADFKRHHAHRVVLRDRPLEHVVKSRGHAHRMSEGPPGR